MPKFGAARDRPTLAFIAGGVSSSEGGERERENYPSPFRPGNVYRRQRARIASNFHLPSFRESKSFFGVPTMICAVIMVIKARTFAVQSGIVILRINR